MLVEDAKVNITSLFMLARKKLTINILEKIDTDLDFYDKTSILFLISNDSKLEFEKIIFLAKNYENGDKRILTEFIKSFTNNANWKEAMLEALCTINNKKVIRKLGFIFSDLEAIFSNSNMQNKSYINPIKKCLYRMCESLKRKDTLYLINNVIQRLNNYCDSLKNIQHLELHILYWNTIKFISISNGCQIDIKNILCELEKLHYLELIYNDLRIFHNLKLNFKNVENISVTAQTLSSESEEIFKIKTGLCIIINEIFFEEDSYETRFGSTADCEKLEETFRGLGFEVHVSENLMKLDFIQKIEEIPEKYGVNFDCLFFCIMSHGYKGGIVTSDNGQISLEFIEQKICNPSLKNVIKIVLIQACQGNIMGLNQEEHLSTDGAGNKNKPNVELEDICCRKDFCMFMSTMQGYQSIRHIKDGSWFIQEFCSILQKSKPGKKFLECVTSVTKAVTTKKGTIDNNHISQLPEMVCQRLTRDFQFPEYHC